MTSRIISISRHWENRERVMRDTRRPKISRLIACNTARKFAAKYVPPYAFSCPPTCEFTHTHSHSCQPCSTKISWLLVRSPQIITSLHISVSHQSRAFASFPSRCTFKTVFSSQEINVLPCPTNFHKSHKYFVQFRVESFEFAETIVRELWPARATPVHRTCVNACIGNIFFFYQTALARSGAGRAWMPRILGARFVTARCNTRRCLIALITREPNPPAGIEKRRYRGPKGGRQRAKERKRARAYHRPRRDATNCTATGNHAAWYRSRLR